MKKITALLLSVLLAFTMAGCAGNSNTETQPEPGGTPAEKDTQEDGHTGRRFRYGRCFGTAGRSNGACLSAV